MSDNIKSERGMANCAFHADGMAYFSTTASAIINNQKEGFVLGSLDFKDFAQTDGLEEHIDSEPVNKAADSTQGKIKD